MKEERIFRIFSFVVGALMLSSIIAPVSVCQDPVEEVMGVPVGWSDDVRLTNNSLFDKVPEIAVWNDNIHMVWTYNNRNILYSKSEDSGKTWSPFINLYSTPAGVDNPHIAVEDQNVHVLWEDWTGVDGIYYRNSTDGGETWNTVRRISPNIFPWDAGNPHVFVNNSNLHILWHDFRVGTNGQVFYRRSLDGGISFDNGQGLDEDRQITFSPGDIGGVNMDGDGSNISVVWYDDRSGVFDIYWMISKDNGFTWEDGLGNVGQDRRLTFTGANDCAVAMNGPNIHAVYIDPVDINTYNLKYINSTNNGTTWSSPQLLSGSTPMIASPDITVNGENIHVVWDDARDDGTTMEIYYKNSTDGGISWSPDLRLTDSEGSHSYHPRVGLNDSTIHVTWWDRRDGNREVYYKRYPDFPPDPEYNISLSQGWNLVSIPLEQSDESLDQVLQSIDGKWDMIQTYDSLSPDHWKSNATYKPDQLNELKTLDHKMGFWIHMNESANLTVSGPIPTSTTIDLYAGWNLVGYPTLNNTTDVGDAFWGTGTNRVEVFNASEPYNIKEVGPGYIMKPGEGYWVRVPVDTVWTIDW